MQRTPAAIGGLVFPRYRFGGATELLPCTAAQAAVELLQQCWSPLEQRETAMPYLCNLVAGLPAFHLLFSDGDLASEMLSRSTM
jgi:hypothetical protein